MKSIIRLLFVLFVVFTSCKKDANPVDTLPETEDSLTILTKAYYYFGDTLSTPAVDSFYYNTKHQIEKVTAKVPYITGTPTYWLTYNDKGDLATVKGNGDNLATKQEYFFFYDTKRILDSIIILDHSWNDDSIAMTFSYDANDHIKSYHGYFLKTHSGVLPRQIEGASLYSGSFYRNGGRIDSTTSQGYIDGKLANKAFIHFDNTAISRIPNIDKSYLFILSTNLNIYMAHPFNPFWYQYINPDISMFKGGTFEWNHFTPGYKDTKHPYQCYFETDSENRVRLIYIKHENPEYMGTAVKLEYTKIAK